MRFPPRCARILAARLDALAAAMLNGATTGIAAANVGGTTIHRAAGVGVPGQLRDFGRIWGARVGLQRRTNRLPCSGRAQTSDHRQLVDDQMFELSPEQGSLFVRRQTGNVHALLPDAPEILQLPGDSDARRAMNRRAADVRRSDARRRADGIAAANVGGTTIHRAAGVGVPGQLRDFGRIWEKRVDVPGLSPDNRLPRSGESSNI